MLRKSITPKGEASQSEHATERSQECGVTLGCDLK
jgi:hypothetical protein